MKVCVLGLGYIGLPTAAILAAKGLEVIGVDTNEAVVETINRGEVHFVEPEVAALLSVARRNGVFKCSGNIGQADVFVIAVPTPATATNKADLSAIETVVTQIGPVLKKGNLVILESTSTVGTTEKIAESLKSIRPELVFPSYGTEGAEADVNIAYCPERVLPGQILEELRTNDRILGGISRVCALKAKRFYASFVEGNCALTDSRTAELCKLSENAFRDVNIAFANELSLVCDRLEIDVWQLIRFANRHPRVNILQPGPGVGGHCVAVDPWFIVESAPEESHLIKVAREINSTKPRVVFTNVEKAIAATGKEASELTIACFGLSFKRDVDDLRGSPAVEIAEMIVRAGFKDVMLVEPHLQQIPTGRLSAGSRLVDSGEAISRADICVLLVDHAEFRTLDKELFRSKQVIDTRGVWA